MSGDGCNLLGSGSSGILGPKSLNEKGWVYDVVGSSGAHGSTGGVYVERVRWRPGM
jgi:hypothetical protein